MKGGKEVLPATKVSDRCCTSSTRIRTFQVASRFSRRGEGKRPLWLASLDCCDSVTRKPDTRLFCVWQRERRCGGRSAAPEDERPGGSRHHRPHMQVSLLLRILVHQSVLLYEQEMIACVLDVSTYGDMTIYIPTLWTKK